eukprot:CAMPEP_0194340086 /NCGR_PEP_ID=MMETSP0171-20130528/85262_1 /TAXON_ID=218684 /ORGANISM="Corethron pennatum, Strain L29A3" /LENGTH=101 /DNA_ID=CAMNT_0039104899 /DNA_START=270 /DNA_END=576 /DNA_ORIENTATION=+
MTVTKDDSTACAAVLYLPTAVGVGLSVGACEMVDKVLVNMSVLVSSVNMSVNMSGDMLVRLLVKVSDHMSVALKSVQMLALASSVQMSALPSSVQMSARDS